MNIRILITCYTESLHFISNSAIFVLFSMVISATSYFNRLGHYTRSERTEYLSNIFIMSVPDNSALKMDNVLFAYSLCERMQWKLFRFSFFDFLLLVEKQYGEYEKFSKQALFHFFCSLFPFAMSIGVSRYFSRIFILFTKVLKTFFWYRN